MWNFYHCFHLQIYVGSLTFYYKKRTPWKFRFDEGLTRLIESGIIGKTYSDFVGPEIEDIPDTEAKPLTLTHLQGWLFFAC